MENVTVQIRIDRAAAIMEGMSQYGVVKKEIDPVELNAEQREVLIEALKGYNCINDFQNMTPIGRIDDTMETVRQILNEFSGLKKQAAAKKAAENEEEEIERQKKIAALDVGNTATWIQAHRFLIQLHVQNWFSDNREHFKYKQMEAIAAEKKKEDELKREKYIEKQRQEREDREEREERQKAERVELLNTILNPGQKRQLERGLLSEQQQRALACRSVFASFGDYPRYDRLTADDICECEYRELEFDTDDADSLTESEFALVEEVEKYAKTLSREYSVEPIEHTGTCEHCDSETTRLSLRLTTQFGDWTLSREFELDARDSE